MNWIYKYLIFGRHYPHTGLDIVVTFASRNFEEAKQVGHEVRVNFVVMKFNPEAGAEELVFDTAVQGV